MREQRQLDRILKILDDYRGAMPLQHFLRNYFRKHHEMGSNDRRITAQFIYNYFRIGKCLHNVNREERLSIASYLVNTVNSPLLEFSLKKYSRLTEVDVTLPLELKAEVIKKVYPSFDQNDLFPFTEYTGSLYDLDAFRISMLQQPYLWIRARNEYKEKIIGVLEKHDIDFTNEQHAIGIKQTVDLKKIQDLNTDWYEIQDWSSQQTGNFYKAQEGEHWLDCCAASGGKSLLLYSLQPKIKLTVSDNRESSLNNLKLRFKQNNIEDYTVISCDLSIKLPAELSQHQYDGIIADVPCTGSGTWSRSPEQLTFFDIQQLTSYTERQRAILNNIIPVLKKGKPLIYITCSVFKEENEIIAEWIAAEFNFEIEESTYLEGASYHADTMYVARLIKK